MTDLEAESIRLAISYVGTKEVGNNRGELVEKVQAFCGARPGDPWCAAFVSWCVLKAAVTWFPTFARSASALRLLARNVSLGVTPSEARKLLAAGTPLVFVMDHGHGKGHTGFALSLLPGDLLHTVEGNTGPGPSAPAQDRDGDGVHERRDRRFADVDGGWLRIG